MIPWYLHMSVGCDPIVPPSSLSTSATYEKGGSNVVLTALCSFQIPVLAVHSAIYSL